MSVDSKMTAIANAIRAKTGKSGLLSLDTMATEISSIQGGNQLNFTVVGGTTEPTNPIENMIWVNTDTNITAWEFRDSEPEAEEGKVWVMVGKGSPVSFNVIKENAIIVYPLFAKQYISGIWVEKKAKSYQGGNWREWLPEGAIYYHGNEIEDITGGWSQYSYSGSSYWSYIAPKKNDSELVFNVTSPGNSSGAHCGLVTENTINLANIKKIRINIKECSITGTTPSVGLQILTTKTPSNSNTFSAFLKLTNGQTGIAELDTTSLNSSYYISLVAMASGAGAKASLTIDEVLLYE